jgi:uncharacterized membrane protein
MKNSRLEVSHLIQKGIISPDEIDNALIVTNITPSNAAWKDFLEKLLLWLGFLAIGSSVLFFIAFNWDEMDRFSKFGLVEALIALSIFIYWKTTRGDTAAIHIKESMNLNGKVALLMASIFLGVLLAFYGQTYQTGADTWQLFLTWCVLILPWTIVSKFPALWMLWLSLLNLSIVLYFQIFGGILGILFTSENDLLWILTILNSFTLILWELLESRYKWLSEKWAIRLIALGSVAPLTFLAIESIFDRQSGLLPCLVWVVGLASIYIVYRKRKPDLFMLAIACLSGISVILSFMGDIIFELGSEMAAYLALAILVITLGAISAIWLKGIHKEHLWLEGDQK